MYTRLSKSLLTIWKRTIEKLKKIIENKHVVINALSIGMFGEVNDRRRSEVNVSTLFLLNKRCRPHRTLSCLCINSQRVVPVLHNRKIVTNTYSLKRIFTGSCVQKFNARKVRELGKILKTIRVRYL
jgi:hypothetical protein